MLYRNSNFLKIEDGLVYLVEAKGIKFLTAYPNDFNAAVVIENYLVINVKGVKFTLRFNSNYNALNAKVDLVNKLITLGNDISNNDLDFDSNNGGNNEDLSNYYNKTEVNNLLDNKVDSDGTKVLSDNNFTDAYQEKIDDLDNETVKINGNQTINDIKTFQVSPIVPSKSSAAANSPTELATEAQVFLKQNTLSGNGILSFASSTASYIAGTANQLLRRNAANTAYEFFTPTYTSNTGTVTSVNLSMPTEFSVANNPITTSGTIAITMSAGYSIPTTTNITQWNDAYSWGNHSSEGYYKLPSGGTTAQYLRGDGTLNTFPTIPTVNNGTLTLTTSADLTGSATFTANNASNVTFTVSLASTTSTNILNGATAYSWGNHASAGYASTSALTTGLDGKVNIEADKGLSSNDFETSYKTYLDTLPELPSVNGDYILRYTDGTFTWEVVTP
jgi:hypothetical protein